MTLSALSPSSRRFAHFFRKSIALLLHNTKKVALTKPLSRSLVHGLGVLLLLVVLLIGGSGLLFDLGKLSVDLLLKGVDLAAGHLDGILRGDHEGIELGFEDLVLREKDRILVRLELLIGPGLVGGGRASLDDVIVDRLTLARAAGLGHVLRVDRGLLGHLGGGGGTPLLAGLIDGSLMLATPVGRLAAGGEGGTLGDLLRLLLGGGLGGVGLLLSLLGGGLGGVGLLLQLLGGGLGGGSLLLGLLLQLGSLSLRLLLEVRRLGLRLQTSLLLTAADVSDGGGTTVGTLLDASLIRLLVGRLDAVLGVLEAANHLGGELVLHRWAESHAGELESRAAAAESVVAGDARAGFANVGEAFGTLLAGSVTDVHIGQPTSARGCIWEAARVVGVADQLLEAVVALGDVLLRVHESGEDARGIVEREGGRVVRHECVRRRLGVGWHATCFGFTEGR